MKSFTTFLFLFIASCAFSQRVTITQSLEKFGDELNPAYKLYIPYADEKTVLREWSSFLKSSKGKVKTSKNEVNATNALMPLITKDTMNIYSFLSGDKDGTLLSASFEVRESFISPGDYPAESESVKTVLKDFGLNLARQGHKSRIEESEKALSAQQRQNADLKKRNERLRSDNEKMKSQINDNEREIKDNEKKLVDLEIEIGVKQSSLNDIKAKSVEPE